MNKVKCVQPCASPCTYVINKHIWRKEVHWSTLVRTEKAIGVDLLVPRSSTPLDILRMGVARWTFFLGCVWLGHRIITNHVCAQAVTRFYPVPPKTWSCTLIIKDWNLRS